MVQDYCMDDLIAKKIQLRELMKTKKSDIEIDKTNIIFDLPLGYQQVILKYGNYLTPLEQKEIVDFEQVYYLGQKAQKTINDPCNKDIINSGYDNNKGELIFIPNDHIGYRYEIICQLGKGSFGQVFKVYDHKRKVFSAVKVIKNKKQFHAQALIEIQILIAIRKQECDGLIKMKDYLLFRNHVCLIFELMNHNLYEILRNNKFQGFDLNLVRNWSLQILKSLQQLEKIDVIHCDLKPENILLKQQNMKAIKVIDFGSSCFRNSKIYTYIQSRFYRAPEIILGIPYDTPIDLWSFGCILVELVTGYPLFPSDSEQDHLSLVIEVLGVPPISILKYSPKSSQFFDDNYQPKHMMSSDGQIHRMIASRPLEQILEGFPFQLIDFASQFLKWNPDERIKLSDALVHPWILEA